MYLVELRPGKEELYRSSDELARAIRNGDVNAGSRVYHRATAKWISITLHPQYRAIVAAAKEESAVRPARRSWSLLGGSPERASSSPDVPAGNGATLHRWRRPLALGISALLLMSGIQLAFSGPRPQWTSTARRASATAKNGAEREVASIYPVIQEPNDSASAEPADSAPSRLAEAAPSQPAEAPSVVSLAGNKLPPIPRAPRLRAKSLNEAMIPGPTKPTNGSTLDALVARYEAARDSVESRLETGMRVARLARLFSPSRLSPNGGVTDTRISLAGVANFIRVYHRQQAMVERAYEDTVTTLAREQGWSPKRVRAWYSRAGRREAPNLELLSNSLLSSIDSVLGVLDAQAGAYKIRGTAIAFEDPRAGQTYGALRRRIDQQIDAAIAAGAATSPGPAGLLLQAIGTSTLPRKT